MLRDLRVEQVDACLNFVVANHERLCLRSLRGDLLLQLGDALLVRADGCRHGRGHRGHTGQDEAERALNVTMVKPRGVARTPQSSPTTATQPPKLAAPTQEITTQRSADTAGDLAVALDIVRRRPVGGSGKDL